MIYLGIDWAEDHHDLCLLDEAGERLATARVPDGVEGLRRLHELVALYAHSADLVVVGIETDRGLLVQGDLGERRLHDFGRARQPRRAPTHVIDHRHHIGASGFEPSRQGRVVAGERIDQTIIAVENENAVVIKKGLEPLTNALLCPVGIEVGAEIARRQIGGRNAFDFAKDTVATRAQRAREHLLFMLDRDFVGALGRGEYGDHDADNGDGHNDADRDHDAQPRAIPTGILLFLLGTRALHSQHLVAPKASQYLGFSGQRLGGKACHWLS